MYQYAAQLAVSHQISVDLARYRKKIFIFKRSVRMQYEYALIVSQFVVDHRKSFILLGIAEAFAISVLLVEKPIIILVSIDIL